VLVSRDLYWDEVHTGDITGIFTIAAALVFDLYWGKVHGRDIKGIFIIAAALVFGELYWYEVHAGDIKGAFLAHHPQFACDAAITKRANELGPITRLVAEHAGPP